MDITSDDLQERLESDSPPTVLDVRSSLEYSAGHLPGAIHLPFWKSLFKINQIISDKDSTLIIYCEHGPRAVLAQQALNARGFSNVRCLKGHMHGWRRDGRPVVKGR